MWIKIRNVFALAFVLTLMPALAAPHVLEVPGPSLIVLETTVGVAPELSDDPASTLRPIVLEASPARRVLAVGEPGWLVVDAPPGGEVVATITRVRLSERAIRLPNGVRAVARTFRPAFATKEEDHDIDPDPKGVAERPLVTLITVAEAVVLKEEDHDIDPDPKGGVLDPAWADDWVLASAAVAELGPGWYFLVRGGEVSYEVLVAGR